MGVSADGVGHSTKRRHTPRDPFGTAGVHSLAIVPPSLDSKALLCRTLVAQFAPTSSTRFCTRKEQGKGLRIDKKQKT
eukprot:scaffold17325_cov18-Tisochrysis_lutea.AAC.1